MYIAHFLLSIHALMEIYIVSTYRNFSYIMGFVLEHHKKVNITIKYYT